MTATATIPAPGTVGDVVPGDDASDGVTPSRGAAVAPVRTGRTAFATYSAVCLLLCVIAAWYAPDIPFSSDQGQVLGLSESANAAHHIARYGLTGSHTMAYGPFPETVQQIVLALGGDLLPAARLYSFGYFAAIAAGLYGLTRLLGLPVWYAFLFLAGPTLWGVGRTMWDNTLLFPTLLAAVVCYGFFVRTGKSVWAVGTALGCGLAMLTHLMAIPMVSAIGLHALVCQRPAVLRAWLPVGLTLLALVVYAMPYSWQEMNRVYHRLHDGRTVMVGTAGDALHGIPHLVGFPDQYPPPAAGAGGVTRAASLGYAFLGARLFAAPAAGIGLPTRSATLEALAGPARIISWIAIPLSLVGIGLMAAAGRLWKVSPERRAVAAVLLTALALFAAMKMYMGQTPDLFYYHGMVVFFFVAVALGVHCLRTFRAGNVVAGLLIASLAILSTQQVLAVQQHPVEMTSLRALIEVAKPMAAYAPRYLDTPVQSLAVYPHTLTAVVGYYQRRSEKVPTPVDIVSLVPSGDRFELSVGPLPAGSAYRVDLSRTLHFTDGRPVIDPAGLPPVITLR